MVKNNKILASLLFFFLIALSGRSQTTQSLEKKIEAIQKDIKLAEKLLKETAKDKEVTINQVALMQTQINQRENLIKTYQNQVNLINKEIHHDRHRHTAIVIRTLVFLCKRTIIQCIDNAGDDITVTP